MIVCGRVVEVVVDAHHDGDVLVGGRRRDDDLLGAAVDVLAGVRGLGEEAGGLDDDVDAEIAPRQAGRVALGEDPDRLAADPDAVVGDRRPAGRGARGRCRTSAGGPWSSTSPRSLTATISMSAPEAATARKKLRPIRPKPLMPTRTVTVHSSMAGRLDGLCTERHADIGDSSDGHHRTTRRFTTRPLITAPACPG